MKIQILSDLHREVGIPKNNKFVPVGDVVVLAGDITSSSNKHLVMEEFGSCPVPVLYVPGNHEYYKGNWNTEVTKMRVYYEALPKVIRVMDNDHVELGGVHFVGTTFWPNVSIAQEMFVANGISDFVHDRRTGSPMINEISVDKVRIAHLNTYRYLAETMREIQARDSDSKIVVITHFPPTLQAQEERFKGSNLDSYFYNNCGDLIDDYQPDYWIYGHTHGDITWEQGKTKVVTNQYGYHNYETNSGFNKNFVVEI